MTAAEPPSPSIPHKHPASPARYEYAPLEHADSIRILFLRPAPPSQGPIEVALREFRLDDPELAFNALSYTWQTEDGVKADDGVEAPDEKPSSAQLLCDGALLDAPQNCHAALWRLRSADEVRVFWVDAVCINQSNGEERSVQVSLMRRIYSQAGTVVVWFGETSPEVGAETSTPLSDLGMGFIHSFASEISERNRAGLDVAGGALYREFIGDRMEFQRHNTDALTPRVRGLRGILHRSWWTRLWTVQELALARKVLLVLGDKIERFDTLEVVFTVLVRDGQPAEESEYNRSFVAPAFHMFSMRNYLETDRHSVPKAPGEKALEVLTSSRNAVATDPRDKIYGILGFFGDRGSDPHNIFPAPDYSKTAAELYAEVNRAIITTTGSLDVMSSCQGFLASSVPDLPSWAVAWNDTPLQYFSLDSFDAAGGSRVACEDLGDHWLLRLKGRRVDRVVYELGPPSGFEYSNAGCVLLWYWWHRCAFSLPPYLTGEGMEDGRLRPGDYREAFDAWAEILLSEGEIGPDNLESVAGRIFRDETAFKFSRRPGVEVEDEIVVLDGGRVPFVIRAQGDNYKLVGACYVHGIMDGEAVSEGGSASDAPEWFTLC